MADKFPNQNLDPGSQAWARTVESRINQLGEGRSNDNTWQTMGNSATNATLQQIATQIEQLSTPPATKNTQFIESESATAVPDPPENIITDTIDIPPWAQGGTVFLNLQMNAVGDLAIFDAAGYGYAYTDPGMMTASVSASVDGTIKRSETAMQSHVISFPRGTPQLMLSIERTRAAIPAGRSLVYRLSTTIIWNR